MQTVAIQDAPQLLNTNDQAMWVLGYNDAVQKMQSQGRTESEQHMQELRAYELTVSNLRAELESLRQGQCLHKIAEPAAPQPVQHQDDAAVDTLAAVMKSKLAKQRAKGYRGWNDKKDCTQQHLSNLLRTHVDKGDPIDVANFCAFLLARGERIAAAPQAVQPSDEAIEEFLSTRMTPEGRVPMVKTIREALGHFATHPTPQGLGACKDRDTIFFLAGWNGCNEGLEANEQFKKATLAAQAKQASGWLAKLGSPIECYYRRGNSLCDNFTTTAYELLTPEPSIPRYACPVCSRALKQEAALAAQAKQGGV